MLGLAHTVSNRVKIASTVYDWAAENFIDTTAITDSTQKSAIRTLVSDLKIGDVWSYLPAFYPAVGGAALPHSYNLVDTSRFQLTFSGGFTHDADGFTGDGITGYVLTGFNPVTEGIDRRNFGVFSYGTLSSIAFDMGSATSSSGSSSINIIRKAGSVFQKGQIASSNLSLSLVGAGGLAMTMRNSTTVELVQGAAIGQSGTEGVNFTDAALPNLEIYLCTRNVNGAPGPKSNSRFSAFGFTRYLNAARKTAFDAAMTTFQTTLGRNI